MIRYPTIFVEGSLVGRFYPECLGIDLLSAVADNDLVVDPIAGPFAGC